MNNPRTKRKTLSIILAACIIISVALISTFTVLGALGSEEEQEIQISTAEGLRAFATRVNAGENTLNGF